MKYSFVTFVIFSLISFGASAQKIHKALFVIVDGIPADVVEKVNTPHLDAIAKKGGYTHAHVGGEKGGYSETPTISAVGYNSLLTGTWVNKHNVWGNNIVAPNYNYPTIFHLFKDQYPKRRTAIFSSWLDNRTKLVGENLSATGNIKLDYHFDGLELDTVNYPHDNEKNYMHRIDEAVVDNAANYIRKEAPDLSWVYLEYTDDMGHRYGDSKKLYDAVEMMDAQMGRLWQSIQFREKNFKEDWVIYITTDHGRDAATGKGHGGQSDRERNTWIVTNASGLNNYFKTGNPGIVDIMPSIAQFLNLSIPRNQLMEIDGIPLTGKLYATNPAMILENGKLHVSWKALEKNGKAKIWLSTTNNFKSGEKDNYILQATVPVSKEAAVIDVSKTPSSFYKVVIETPGNMLNRWVIVKE